AGFCDGASACRGRTHLSAKLPPLSPPNTLRERGAYYAWISDRGDGFGGRAFGASSNRRRVRGYVGVSDAIVWHRASRRDHERSGGDHARSAEPVCDPAA